MPAFRKKDVFEAEQFLGKSIFGLEVSRNLYFTREGNDAVLSVPTCEGWRDAFFGDWVIRAPQEDEELFSICRVGDFEQMYELIQQAEKSEGA